MLRTSSLELRLDKKSEMNNVLTETENSMYVKDE